jgi:hypothetical protein
MHGDFGGGGSFGGGADRWLPWRTGAAWGLIGDGIIIIVAVFAVVGIATLIFH